MRQRETARVLIFELLKSWRNRFNSRSFVNLRDSRDKSRLERTGTCREYTPHRDDPESGINARTDRHTRIGPVLQVKTTCYLSHLRNRYSDLFHIRRRLKIVGWYIQRQQPLRGGVTIQ